MTVTAREDRLAPYAMREGASLGRKYPEPAHPYRGIYQRDRDRILHASAFRRMTAKTQVLVWGTNDHHRTRLTHTLEVAQVSRTIARELQLNEDLTEAIALAHDLGHPPFGHAGEAALDAQLQQHGGFEHNRHGLRIVEVLEQRYPEFPGLNLTWEVRESLAFHSKRPESPEIRQYRRNILQPTLEAQIVDAADSVVYDIHDLEDALGVNLIQLEDVRNIQFWKETELAIKAEHPGIPANRMIPTILRLMLARREQGLLANTRHRLKQAGISSISDVNVLPEPLVAESPQLEKMISELRQFLLEKVYQHERVLQMSSRGKQIIHDLFRRYEVRPELLPALYHQRTLHSDPVLAIGDYIAGMTDRLATFEHDRLFQSHE